MYVTIKTTTDLIKDLRKVFPKLDLNVTEAESGRSLVFEASKQLTHNCAQFKYKRISYKKLTEMTEKEVNKEFNKL